MPLENPDLILKYRADRADRCSVNATTETTKETDVTDCRECHTETDLAEIYGATICRDCHDEMMEAREADYATDAHIAGKYGEDI